MLCILTQLNDFLRDGGIRESRGSKLEIALSNLVLTGRREMGHWEGDMLVKKLVL